jgi:polysaccharide chain length determinant protein (PEP-CTERM system associated)
VHEQAQQLTSNLRAAWRYRWLAIATAWIIAICGWAVVYRMPDGYEATARVWVDTQSMLKHLLAGLTAQPNGQDLVGMLSRTLISRPNLERLIGMAGMDSEIETPEHRERMITGLSKQVTVSSAGGVNLFTIAYTDRDPQRAELVVRSLLTIFVEGSPSDQRKDSEAAQRFIDEEIKTYKEKLDAAENAMIEFKRRRLLAAGARGDYGAQLASLQATLRELALDLKIAELDRDAIKKHSGDQAEIPDLLSDRGTERLVNPEPDARIKDLEQKRDSLRSQYTDQHPDVVAIVRMIAQLEDQKKKAEDERNAEARPRKFSPSEARTPIGSQQLRLSVATAEANVAVVKARIAEHSKRYEELKSAAIAAPEIDAEYAHLSRDYEMAKTTYASMLSRREIARISEKMESTTKVMTFRVVDPPRASYRPKSPNRPQLNSIVLAVALAGGFVLAYVVSQLTPTIGDERRLREISGAQVLATVVRSWTDAEKRKRNWGLITLLMSFVGLLTAFAAITFAVTLVSGNA